MVRHRALGHGVFWVQAAVVLFCCIKIPKFHSTWESISESLCSGQTLEQLTPSWATFPGCLHAWGPPQLHCLISGSFAQKSGWGTHFLDEVWVLVPDSEPGPFPSWGLPKHRGRLTIILPPEGRMDAQEMCCHTSCMNILNNIHVMKTLRTPRSFWEPEPCPPPVGRRSRIPFLCWQKYSPGLRAAPAAAFKSRQPPCSALNHQL